jgi:hypothetical protein
MFSGILIIFDMAAPHSLMLYSLLPDTGLLTMDVRTSSSQKKDEISDDRR